MFEKRTTSTPAADVAGHPWSRTKLTELLARRTVSPFRTITEVATAGPSAHCVPLPWVRPPDRTWSTSTDELSRSESTVHRWCLGAGASPPSCTTTRRKPASHDGYEGRLERRSFRALVRLANLARRRAVAGTYARTRWATRPRRADD